MPILAQSTEVEDTISRALKSLDSQAIIKDTDLGAIFFHSQLVQPGDRNSGLLTLAPGQWSDNWPIGRLPWKEVLVELEEVASGTSSLSGLATLIGLEWVA